VVDSSAQVIQDHMGSGIRAFRLPGDILVEELGGFLGVWVDET
jgi:hypothetical protein